MSEVLSLLRALAKTIVFMTVITLALVLFLGAVYFPYPVDDPSLDEAARLANTQ